jgi:hypothetical protein
MARDDGMTTIRRVGDFVVVLKGRNDNEEGRAGGVNFLISKKAEIFIIYVNWLSLNFFNYLILF